VSYHTISLNAHEVKIVAMVPGRRNGKKKIEEVLGEH
jgi:hypothetical protein